MAQSYPVIKNAWTLLTERSTNIVSVVTFCEKLDNGLGGGISLGRITEIVGPASIGKTQICFQLAVDVQIPTEFAGVGGKCVYVDTECCYKAKRVEEIANAAVRHCQEIASSSSDLEQISQGFTLESILDGIYVNRCWDLASLTSTLEGLEKFLLSHPKVKLIIVDSLAFHFRDDQWTAHERKRLLLKSVTLLTKIACKFQIAVVAVNQMTTRPTDDGCGFEEPALNEILTQNAGDQIILGWRKRKNRSDEDTSGVDRCALLYKSSRRAQVLALYKICANGVRDV